MMLQEVINFLAEYYFLPIYFISLILSIVKYRRYFDTELKYFPILIAYTFLNELLGVLIREYPSISLFEKIEDSSYNLIIYNIYSVIFFCYFYYVYWKLIANKKFKNWIFKGAIVVLASFIISCFFQNPNNVDLFYAVSIASWFLVFSIILYALDKHLKKEKIVQKYNLVFWVSLALFIFYNVFPVIFLIGYLNYDLWVQLELRTVLRTLIIIMHGFFCIGFLVNKRRAFG